MMADPMKELIFEGEGEAGHLVVVSPIVLGRRRFSPPELNHRFIHSDTDSSDSLDPAELESNNQMLENSYGDLGIDAVSCPQPLCCSSPIRSSSSSSFGVNPDSSRISPDQSGFEGIGKGHEKSLVDHVALQAQVDELKYQNRKLLQEVADLQRQMATADDAQNSLLCHNEELEKKVVQCKGHSDKLRFISKELEETKATLACHEDKHTVLKKRIDRLEKDNAILTGEIEDRLKENLALTADLDKSRQQVKDIEEKLTATQLIYDEKLKELTGSKVELEDRLRACSDLVEELKLLNEQLESEKSELESNLTLAHESHHHLDSRLTGLEISTSVGDITFEEEDDLISFRASSCTPVTNSIHSEIAASLFRPNSELPHFRHDSLITYTTSGSSFQWDLESAPDFSHRMRCILTEVLEELREISQEFWNKGADREGGRCSTDGNNPDPSKDPPLGLPGSVKCEAIEEIGTGGEKEGAPTTPADLSHEPEKEVDVVQRIHEELAEFRVQLKKSQELFHAFNNTQTFEVTKSCPLLADEKDSSPAGGGGGTAEDKVISKPQLSTVSTQTDVPAVASSSSSPLQAAESRVFRNHTSGAAATTEDVEDLSNYMNKLALDDNDLDKLSLDDDSYRLTINLPTVLEESEQETETSPATLPRRMSSERSKRRLQRMSQFEECNSNKSENESEREFYSPPSSLPSSKNPSTYNSLERPLQFSSAAQSPQAGGGGSLQDDHESLRSDSTYGSPLSSPSYYYTPSQGSSEETIANNDGDKTPVNEDFMDEIASDPSDSNKSSPKHLVKRPQSIGKIRPLIDDRPNIFAQKDNDESAKEELIKYAFDPVLRSVCNEAAVLTRREWRTLKEDKRTNELLQYSKNFAQEEGTDNDGMDRGPVRPDVEDPDDEAEKIIFENPFPNVVEKLFESLDRLQLNARPDFKISDSDFDKINNRFLSLSTAFKTGHKSLHQREEQSTKELETVRNKINDNVHLLTSSVKKLREGQNSYDFDELLHCMEESSKELLINSETLTKKAKEVGSIDLEKRVYKLIEVMILYVHILRNYEVPSHEHKSPKKASHDDSNEESPAKKFNGNIASNNNNNNNNNNEKVVRWTGGYLGEGQRMERWMSKGYEFVRRELSWPWNWEQTWKGVKQCFSFFLMLTGLVIIFRSVFPIVSADIRGCSNSGQSPPTIVSTLLGKEASLIHEQTPTL